MRLALLLRTLGVVASGSACLAETARAQDDVGCRKGTFAAVQAYIMSNPLYTPFMGSFEQYVAQNAGLYGAGGDGVRCLSALSRAFMAAAFQLYNPQEQRSRDSLNTEIEVVTGNRPRQESTPGGDLYAMSRRMARLARGLPAAAQGDWRVYNTPVDGLGQTEIAAEQAWLMFQNDPMVKEVMRLSEPMLKKIAAIELVAVLRTALDIGERSCSVTPNDTDCIFRDARLAVERKDFSSARLAFARVRVAEPMNEGRHVNEGFYWYKAGQISDAEQATRRALVVNPQSYQANDNLGFILFDRGHHAEALTHFEAALLARPDAADALAGKAIALIALGRATEAVAFYRRAVQLEERFRDCAEMRKKSYWSQIACDAAAPLIRQMR